MIVYVLLKGAKNDNSAIFIWINFSIVAPLIRQVTTMYQFFSQHWKIWQEYQYQIIFFPMHKPWISGAYNALHEWKIMAVLTNYFHKIYGIISNQALPEDACV